MRSVHAVESVESHVEYEESTAQAGNPQHHYGNGTIPMLFRWYHVNVIHTVNMEH